MRPDSLQVADVRILAVAPDAQRRGIGKALLEPILAEADRQGLPTYLEASEGLCTVSVQAAVPALTSCSRSVGAKLYRKLGFVACGELASCASNPAASASLSFAAVSRSIRTLTRECRRN